MDLLLPVDKPLVQGANKQFSIVKVICSDEQPHSILPTRGGVLLFLISSFTLTTSILSGTLKISSARRDCFFVMGSTDATLSCLFLLIAYNNTNAQSPLARGTGCRCARKEEVIMANRRKDGTTRYGGGGHPHKGIANRMGDVEDPDRPFDGRGRC